MAQNVKNNQNTKPAKPAFSQKLLEIAEALPVYLAKGTNAALRALLGGSRSERLINEILPVVEEIRHIGDRLEEDLKEDFSKRSAQELLEHLPDKLRLVLDEEILRDSPEEVRDRRCNEIEKNLAQELGENLNVEVIPGLTLSIQSKAWNLLLSDDLRAKLAEEMRDRLTNNLEIAVEPTTKEQIRKAAAEKFPADVARDLARAIISRVEKALRMPVSELFFKPLTHKYIDRLNRGETLDDLLPEAFATGRLASQLVIKTPGDNPKPMRHFDVQIIGGIVLHQGKIAEMVTGEGKTLVSTLPAYLNALTRKGVHVITTNDFLARRDAAWMGPLHEFLGLTVGYLGHDKDIQDKQKAYQADITYGTNDEFGFDYLRDNMKTDARMQVQRPLHYAIVDEVDNILIDEARTPLIISGMPEESTDKYYKANSVAQRLRSGIDYAVQEKEHTVTLTEEGIVHAQEMLGVESFYSGENVDWPHHMNQALAAKELYKRDRDYVVKNGEVIIVDEFTGRMMPGRRWSDGLHQAVEAKERLRIKQETQTLATITYQNLFRMYDKLAGMTGTALTEAEEFDKIYSLDVVPIPTNKPLRRISFPDVIYATSKEKYEAIVDEIVRVHGTGRPVLVGTIAIEISEHLSKMLDRRGIKHEVLNAKQHEREAAIIADAGQPGAVTIATNMAGRGTDIVLGDSVVQCSQCILREGGEQQPDDNPHDVCRKLKFNPDKTKSGIENIPCGLHIIGTERHEARRIDNQLRGRAGRQGDPGSSRFFLSLEDDLMRIFMGEWVRGFMGRAGFGEGQQIESGMVSRAIERAQKKVEQYNFEIRKNLLEYDEVMDEQRRVVYDMRQKVLDAMVPVEIREAMRQLVDKHISDELRNGPELHLVTHRTFEPLEKQLESFGAKISEEEWLQADESHFAELIKQRINPAKLKFGKDYIGEWIRPNLERLMPEDQYPLTWSFRHIAEWARRHGIPAQEQKLREQAQQAIFDLVINNAVEAAKGKDLKEYLRPWVTAALIIDLPLLANGPQWEYSHVRFWAEKLGFDIPVAEWEPISRKRDKQEELILDRALKACAGKQIEDVVRKFTRPLLELYTDSPLFKGDPRAARIALWAEHRLGAHIAPAEIEQKVASLKQSIIKNTIKAKQDQIDADPNKAAGELAVIAIERYLAKDLAADDRDLVGIAATFEERYGVELSVFELSKLSYPELVAYLSGKVPQEINYEVDAETVEEMVLDMTKASLDRSIDQFIDERVSPDALYDEVQEWLAEHGYTISREEWRNLSLPELQQTLSLQARGSHADESKEQIIEKFVPATIETFLDSPLFAGEGGYATLANWASDKFCFRISDSIEADIRKLADKRKAELRKELIEAKTEGCKMITDDPAEAAAQVVGEVVDVQFESAAGTEDFDEVHVANWAAKAFSLTLSRNELENRLEMGESGIREYIVEMAQKSYARRTIDKVVEDAVDAVLDMTTAPGFIEDWKYDLLQQWIKDSRSPMSFDIPEFESGNREAIMGYFLDLARKGYENRAKEEVAPGVVSDALLSFIDCRLSTEGRNYRALSLKLNQKFNLGVSPFHLSKMGRNELEQWIHDRVNALFTYRKRSLGKYNFLRSVSVLVLHTLDTRWKDHLYAMDHLKSGIGLRGYAGVDPKDAYKKEGYEMFMKMLSSSEESISDLALKVYFDDEESREVARRRTADEHYVHESSAAFNRGRDQAAASAGKEEAKPKPIKAQKAPGRNDPCPCGRTKPDGTPVKYKNCCMNKAS